VERKRTTYANLIRKVPAEGHQKGKGFPLLGRQGEKGGKRRVLGFNRGKDGDAKGRKYRKRDSCGPLPELKGKKHCHCKRKTPIISRRRSQEKPLGGEAEGKWGDQRRSNEKPLWRQMERGVHKKSKRRPGASNSRGGI